MKCKLDLNRLQFVALVALFFMASMAVFSVPANADNLYASVKGTVSDPTGAVVAGAKITATNTATGVSYNATSDKNGLFNFLQLAIGDYTVRAEQTGFKKFQAAGIHLDVNQIYNLPITLALGAVSEEIIVEANPVQVQQTDMQLGSTISGQQIVDIPLNGRNWTQLQQLQPGIVGTSDRFGGNGGAFSGNGAETQQNSFLINGVDSNDASLNTALVIPSPDAIGEFRLVTSTLNPEFGRNSGTVINAVIKNGTNAFHGSGFEFYRDTFLDAANFLSNEKVDANGVSKCGRDGFDCRTPFHQNEYGGTIGGPIIKDRSFFFFSYQGFRQKIPQPGAVGTTPVFTTGQFQGGDFSADLANGGFTSNPNPVAMFGDSASPCPVSGGVPCAAQSTTFAQLFSTGIIPTQDFNPLSQKLVNQFNAFNNAGVVVFNPIRVGHDHQFLGRIDHRLTSKDQLWFYGLWETNPTVDTLPFTGTTLPGLPAQALRHYWQFSFSWTHTFSPTTLNELRLGYTRFNFAAVEPVNPINPTAYGFTGITPQNSSASLPVMTTPLFTLGFSANGPQPRIQNVYQLTDNFSKVWGHHTFKAGINIDRPSIDNPFNNNLGGNFGFGGSGLFSTGDGSLDFLLGFPDTYAQGSGSIVDAKAHEIYAYAQDQWQVRPNLTITYGTGYEVFTPWRNAFAHGLIMGAFRPGQQSTVFPTAPVGFVYPGDQGINKYGGPTVKYGLFAPRFGFAWSPGSNRNWSVHGGVGLYYNRSEEELALQTLTNAPFAITSNGAGANCGSVGFANPFLDATGTCSAANPFPFHPFPAGAKNIDFSQFAPIGLGFTGMDPRFTAPRSLNFNLTIERQLDKATIMSLAYVGNRGRHEEGAIVLNNAGKAPGVNPDAVAFGPDCTRGTRLNTGLCPQTPFTEDPVTFLVTSGAPVPGANPYNPNLWGQPGQEETEYNSRYDSLQLTLNRRFSKGLQVLAAYTWSRYFDQTSSLENSSFNFPGINPFCSGCNWAPSANDAPQRFVVSYTYLLPIYSFTHKWKRLTDDWTLSGIYTLQHGTPVGVADFRDYSINCDNNVGFFACMGQAAPTGNPLVFANPRTKQFNADGSVAGNFWLSSGAPYLNAAPAAYTHPASGTLGTVSRNPFYGPGINYGDLALEKNIHIDESRYLQLRFETFNTFNHANFSNPSTNGFNTLDVQDIFGPFGRIFSTKAISTNGEGRAVQLAVKFYF